MPQVLGRWLEGYVLVRVRGYGPERFSNLCRSGQLRCWKIRQERDGYYFCMALKDFYRIRPYLKKSRLSMKIVSRTGFPFVLKQYRKRKALAAAVLSFFMVLYVLSLFVWNISFEGNYHYSRETLLDYLEEEQICCGMRRSQVDCDQLEEDLRSRFPEITWVSARVSGTRLLVKIKENETLGTVREREDEPCELVASAPGVITRLIIRQGKAAVAEGDRVEKGQQLVSGRLSIMNDSGEVVRTALVHADADVYARTVYEYQEIFPGYRTVEVKTGRERKGLGIEIGPYRLRFLLPDLRKDSWNYVTTVTQLHIFEDFYLPLYVERITGEATVSYERPYTREEKEQISREVEENYMKNLMEKGVQIIENNVKIQENGSSWSVEGTVTVEEQIGLTRYITEVEETREPDEHN